MYRTSPEDDRVRAARAAVAERTHLWNVHVQLRRDLMEEEIRVDGLAAAAAAEEEDVDKLERGLRARLFGMSPERRERLATEQQEAVAARTLHEEAVASRDELRAQIAAIDARISALAGAASELEQALAAKQQQLAGTPAGRDLERIAEQLAASDAELVAIDEAIAAGDHATEKLCEVVALGMSAERFGESSSRSALARGAQLARIYQANRLLGATRADLRRFDRELADVGMTLGLSPSNTGDVDVLGAALTESDHEDVNGRVQRVLGRVGERLGELRRRRAAIVTDLEALTGERAHILGDAP